MERGDLWHGRVGSARSAHGCACLVTCASLLGCGEAPDLPQPIERASAPAAHSPLAVTVENGYVTLNARDARIDDIVQEIARRSGLTVAPHAPLDERVTLDFERLPLSEALGRVLRDGSFVLSVAHKPSRAESSPEVSRRLWVLSSSAGAARRVSASASVAGHAQTSLSVEVTESARLALADSDANRRADAVSALGSAHDSPEAASLAHAALSDADPAVREEAAYALGEIGGEMSLRALAQALRDPQHNVKQTAIEALATIGGDQAALALAAILDDPDVALRAAAVDALGEIAGETATRLLQEASADKDSHVGGTAAERLAALRAEGP